MNLTPQGERSLHTTTRETQNPHNYKMDPDHNNTAVPSEQPPVIATRQEPPCTSLLEMSHPKGNQQEAPPQVARNLSTN